MGPKVVASNHVGAISCCRRIAAQMDHPSTAHRQQTDSCRAGPAVHECALCRSQCSSADCDTCRPFCAQRRQPAEHGFLWHARAACRSSSQSGATVTSQRWHTNTAHSLQLGCCSNAGAVHIPQTKPLRHVSHSSAHAHASAKRCLHRAGPFCRTHRRLAADSLGAAALQFCSTSCQQPFLPSDTCSGGSHDTCWPLC